MPLQLAAPIEKEFVLERSDKAYGEEGDKTHVRIRQATQAQHERRSELWSELTQEVMGGLEDPEGIRFIQRLSMPELYRVEAYLTMVGCDILDVDGEPLFKFKSVNGKQVLDMTEREFKDAWGALPPLVANEIHEKVIEVNKTWSKQGE